MELLNKESLEENFTGYCDADWAGNLDDQLAAISWSTKIAKKVALSSTKAEFMTITTAIHESVWLKRLEMEIYEKTTILLSLQYILTKDFCSPQKFEYFKGHFEID